MTYATEYYGGSSSSSSDAWEVSIAAVSRIIEYWTRADETITGTIEWTGQAAKAITGDITFEGTVTDSKGVENHIYRWAYNAADRPIVTPTIGKLVLTDGIDDPISIDVLFVAGEVVFGAGAIRHSLTIQKSGQPVDGAEVWVTTDATGLNIVAGTKHSDAFGLVDFMLDPGSYYAWAQKAGVNFPNPTPFEVTA